MFDARKILDDLQRQAGELAKDVRLDERVDEAKDAAKKLRTRLETDPKARNVAAGAGGLLLLGLLGTGGGRRLVGDVAKLGITAGLGALAYRAWTQRRGGAAGDPRPEDVAAAGYLIEAKSDPDFALALIHAMLGAAYADGVLDARERDAVEAALAGADASDRDALLAELPEAARIAEIKKGARSPNHAAQLFAAAAVMAGDRSASESAFLDRLANALGVHPDEASAIRAGATASA